jgi:hypothetical protein
MTRRKTPLKDHPLMEEAQLIRDILAEDDKAARTGSGRVVIHGDPDEYRPRLRAEAAQLERLARLDVNYPEDD